MALSLEKLRSAGLEPLVWRISDAAFAELKSTLGHLIFPAGSDAGLPAGTISSFMDIPIAVSAGSKIRWSLDTRFGLSVVDDFVDGHENAFDAWQSLPSDGVLAATVH